MLGYGVVAQRRMLGYGMVRRIVDCYHCGSEKLKKNGFSPGGKQKYLCKECGKASRENPAAKGYSEARKEEILRAYQERSSLRGLARTFGVSRTTVTTWLKKSRNAASAAKHAHQPKGTESRSSGTG